MLTSVGVNFEDPRCALKAKAELLTLSAGLLDHFELRMSAPPYSLIQLLSTGASPGEHRRCVDKFLRTPEHCLSEFCKRLRARCPTIASMLGEGRIIVEAWAKGSFLAIDRTERSHGLMRQELRSEHRARSFTRSSHRSLCQELKSLHIRRGGADPAKAGFPTEDRGVSPQGASPQGASPQGASPLGGRHLPPLPGFPQFQAPAFQSACGA